MRRDRDDFLESTSSSIHAANAEDLVSGFEIFDKFTDRIDDACCVDTENSGLGLYHYSEATGFPI
jgi:hypothetical protein